MPKKKWPPPEFPIVEGDHLLTETWAIHLPDKFARRIEDGDLVLWRPGLTLWVTPWGNDRSESQSKRLKAIKKHASPDRFSESESKTDRLTRYVYRLPGTLPTPPSDSPLHQHLRQTSRIGKIILGDQKIENGES